MRVFAYIARDYESATEETSLLSSVVLVVQNGIVFVQNNGKERQKRVLHNFKFMPLKIAENASE